ncbi:hypothetical protein QVD17_39217 [Tagetes erecta]|uniref:Uncharacterized protein n=1 Tax=Tagetes erecta TaxID=13708 RepID=A0AAD8NG16_TARER|nr:hypothetical protein QVD17_39217 [Tagetes erecta]
MRVIESLHYIATGDLLTLFGQYLLDYDILNKKPRGEKPIKALDFISKTNGDGWMTVESDNEAALREVVWRQPVVASIDGRYLMNYQAGDMLSFNLKFMLGVSNCLIMMS